MIIRVKSGKLNTTQESSSDPDDEVVELERFGPEAAQESALALAAEVPPPTASVKRKSQASTTPAAK